MRTIYLSLLLLVLQVFPSLGQEKEEDTTTAKQQITLSLADAISMGLENNYDIRIAAQNVEISKTNNTLENAGLYPTVSTDVDWNHNWSHAAQSNLGILSPTVNSNFTIFNGFQVWITKEQLEELQHYSEGNAQVVIENTIKDIIVAYFESLLEQQRLDVANQLAELSKERFDYTETQKSLGQAVTYDVLQAQNAWLEDRRTALEQKNKLQVKLRDLNFIMGVPEPEQVMYNLTESFEAVEKDYILADLIERVNADNTTLKNNYINQIIKQKDIELAKAAFLPSLKGSANIKYTENYGGAQGIPNFNIDGISGMVGATLSIPIYMGGSRRRAKQIAVINTQIAEIETQQMSHSLNNQMMQVYDTYVLQREILELTVEQVNTAQLNLQMSTERYRTGQINSFNLRDVQIQYLDAQNSRLTAIFNLISTNTEIVRLTGGIIDAYSE
ncbi:MULTISPECIES: TolC family protein [Flammeovirga]|uniref:TolC family protein n=1 Tax=Flammeovirga agarivorans TaxID=2726742 RepID=A0A7X8XYD7_9BACT|nr:MULTISPECIES: TolC family protein [Flammeovirga]NLR94126.1 TolC family protein [Flammeovirga agarivorans]